MRIFLNYFQLLIAILLIVFVLLQRRGGGLSPVLGGGGGFYRTRRGVERLLFIGTIFLVALFLINAVLDIVLK